MRYVVGYQPDERGADAVALAVAIARTRVPVWILSTWWQTALLMQR